MKKLVSHVHVYDKDQNPVVFGPDDDVPAWAAKQMGPHCFADEGGEPSDREVGSVPPKAGAGSSKDAWAAYASEQGVDVEADASRDQIIQAVQDAGKPVDPA